MNAAAAIQAGCDDQRSRDLTRIALDGQIRVLAHQLARLITPPTAPPLVRRAPCDSCTFWRDRYDAVADENEHLARQLTLHHIRPAPRDLPEPTPVG